MPGIARFGQKDYQLRMLTSQALAAGDFINIWNNSGTPNVQKANATGSLAAHGFVNAAYASGAVAVIELVGVNMNQTGLTPGPAYLSTTAGRATSSLPGSGLQQQVGIAIAPTAVVFSPATAVAYGVGSISTAITTLSMMFGDGSDGAFTADGIATPAWATLAGSVYTVTRNAYLTNLTVNAGITIKMNSFQLYGTGTLTGLNATTSLIHNNGNNASGTVGGTNLLTGAYSATTVGADGVNTGNGASATGQVVCIGGSGGAGGANGIRTAGSGGTATPPNATQGSLHGASIFTAVYTGICIGAGPSPFKAGCGGGAGAGDGTHNAGAGGGGGGIFGVFFRFFAGVGTLSAVGGAGSAAGTANSSGGGGGGGGAIFIVTITANWASLWTATVAGGTPGSGAGTGLSGNAGSAGNIFATVLA